MFLTVTDSLLKNFGYLDIVSIQKGCVIVQICIARLNGMFTPETVWGLVIFGKMKARADKILFVGLHPGLICCLRIIIYFYIKMYKLLYKGYTLYTVGLYIVEQ